MLSPIIPACSSGTVEDSTVVQEVQELQIPVLSRDTVVISASSEEGTNTVDKLLDEDLETKWCPVAGDITRTVKIHFPTGFAFDESSNGVWMSTNVKSITVWYNEMPDPIDILSFEEKAEPQFNDLPIGPVEWMTLQIAEDYVLEDQASCIAELDFWTPRP
jgi:hypothetical protein